MYITIDDTLYSCTKQRKAKTKKIIFIGSLDSAVAAKQAKAELQAAPAKSDESWSLHR